MTRFGLLFLFFWPVFCFTQECFDPNADCTFFGSAEFEIDISISCGDTVELLPTQQLCNSWNIPEHLNFEFGLGGDSLKVYVVMDSCYNDSIIVEGQTNTPSGSGIATCSESFIYTFSPRIDTVEQEIPCEAFYNLINESEISQGQCGCDSIQINYTTDFSDCIPCNQQCIFIKGTLVSETSGTNHAEVILTYALNGETLTETHTNWEGRTEELICFSIDDTISIIDIQATLPNGTTGSVDVEAFIDEHIGLVPITELFLESCIPSEVGTTMDTLVASTGCDSIVITTTTLAVLPTLSVSDQQVCIGETITLQAVIDHDVDFEWSTGASTPFIDVTTDGIYTLTVTDAEGCSATTTAEAVFKDIELNVNASVADPFLLNDAPLEVWQGSAVELSVEVFNTNFPYEIIWNKGPEIGDSIYHHIAEQSGRIEVAVIDSIGCIARQVVDVNVRPATIYVPNAFSPNGDDNNDFFNIYTSPNVKELRLQIFSRQGNLVFDNFLNIVVQNDHSLEWQGWDGLFNTKTLNPQAFVYFLRYRIIRDEWNFITGDLVLFKN